MSTEVHQRLEQARKNAGYATAREAAAAMKASYPTYAAHENGMRGIGRAAEKYAKFFNVSLEWLLTGQQPIDGTVRMVPIVGLAGAGPDGSVLFAEGHGNFGEVAAPVDASETAEALEVRGNSMHGLANDGWLVFYDEKTEPQPEHIGEPCVVWLSNGMVLIKIPMPGSQRGLFNLESVNAPTMRDVPVDAMALITDIKTRRAAERYLRNNPAAKVQDLVVKRR